ncbi:NAD(P)H-binding protein [Actinosynnema sp. NPDC047251]|uniref:NAD-dependent epimerase/dehydratase n=1 Tax=Saccharothrix espanaensis (strain ATCC 51144 / DSM 44229 / JCM 9112 / NBRC 15066 / NRRL 15764) TaxID=1179773 RepID=K0JXD8_SACES|nr:NAD(P)H-binding protein [Saccharothrix espanaensis]CCH30751.1 NAD-dependent epimerase/dehydratase [Saccharothrix espanaensis DSM 44229]
MAHIALIGATGTIGSRILDEALRRGHTVTAVVRDPAKLDRTAAALTVETGDVLDTAALPKLLAGHDVVVSAVGGGDGPGHQATIAPAAKSLVEALRAVDGGPRLIVVNGAGSLRAADGTQVWDKPGLPDWLLQIMHAHGDALDYLRGVTDVNWTALSPAATIEAGERTGQYRTGEDDLVSDAEGVSWVSAEDYAVALVDEIEQPKYEGRRFTVAR